MGDIINRLDILYHEHLESLHYLAPRIGKPEYDAHGGAKAVLSLNYRFLSVCEFILNNDKKKFTELLSKSAFLVALNFNDFNSGKITDSSYVKWNKYSVMLDSYASSDESPAHLIAKHIGNLDTDQKEKGFFPNLSYTIKYLVLDDIKNLQIYSDKLTDYLEQKNAKNYLGYPTIIKSYLNKDLKSMKQGFDTLLNDHKRLCKGRGEYSNTEDEVIFLHGLGLLNLLRSRGFEVELNDPLIPKNLLLKLKL